MADRRRHLDHRQEQARARAVQLLQHYVGLLMKKAGLKADADTDAEMEQLVDELLEAATPADTVLLHKHLRDDNVAAHQALDRAGAPRTKEVRTREGTGRQQITLGVAERLKELENGRVVVGIVGLEPDPRD